MYGISATTGRKLGGIDHLRQSIRDILTTPLGSRVMRRDYGSRLFDLIDTPYSSATRLAIIAATAEALITWEPRIEVEDVKLRTYEPGHIIIDLTGRYLPDGREVSIEGIEVG
ncbi:GPW/gp25 family protein [Pukyongiella litopenaei]|uniref:Phage baseplate protein n=1 Tax=Pukyongiella litopenaei TaxID=2605946 RepID=A0A2S0MNS1_9RHOB|nr:GPW/gp25 family protein [Pukyongiella litopenaei]AVO37391.1 phage baseplate protein [Pukyongiella litopenaei]